MRSPCPTSAPRAILFAVALAVAACGGDDGGQATTSSGGSSAAGSTSSPTSTSTSSTTSSSTTTSSTTASSTSSSTAPPTSSSGGGSSSSGGNGDVTLQNDSWTEADGLTWETWAGVGDCWASTYAIDPSLYPFDIVGVQVAIGGATTTETFSVGVWQVDGNGTPATAIDTAMVDMTGEESFDPIDLTGLLDVPTITDGEFALVMCHTDHMGAPSIAIDTDGTVDANRNFVYRGFQDQWSSAPDFFGIDGDFIMRAVVRPQGG